MKYSDNFKSLLKEVKSISGFTSVQLSADYGKANNYFSNYACRRTTNNLSPDITSFLNSFLRKKELSIEDYGFIKRKQNSTILVSYEERRSTDTPDGKGKIESRKRFSSRIELDFGVILSLSGEMCKWEKDLMEKGYDFSYVGVEIEKKRYITMRRTIRQDNLPIYPIHGDILDVVKGDTFKNLKEVYSNIILDSDTTLQTMSPSIEFILKNDLLKVGGLFSVTLYAGRINPKNSPITEDIIKRYNLPTGKNDRKTIKAMEIYFKEIVNNSKYSLLETFTYKDSSPMMVAYIKRNY